MSALELFQYGTQEVRVIILNGDPWFLAVDVCTVLGVGNPTDAVRALDDDEYQLVSAALVTTEGRPQDTFNAVSEAGLYSLVLRSRKPKAREFRRWITHEVIPSIRRTGGYTAAVVVPAVPQTFADALRLAADQADAIERQRVQIAELEPSAQAWDRLAAADGDYAVDDAAKVLSRAPGIKIGRDRLFTLMGKRGWVYRHRSDGRWRTYQGAVESGYLCEMPSSHYHPRSGDLVLDPPQVRVTVKGLRALHAQLSAGTQLALATARG